MHGPARVTVSAGPGGIGGRWEQRLSADGRLGVPTETFAVGDWLRLEVAADQGSPVVRWIEAVPPMAFSLATDRAGADWGETVAITLAGS